MTLAFKNASMEPLWRNLDFKVEPGEFVAILGSNGVGKSTLFNVALKRRALTGGSIDVKGRIGFIPQQRMFDPELPIRARDLVGLSTAHGVLKKRRVSRKQVDAVGDEEHGGVVLAAATVQQFHGCALRTEIHGEQRFVAQQDIRIHCQGLGLANQLLLPTG